MALTDRIASLVTAIATAFNSRIQNPVTGYDVYLLNGGTLSQSDWLASLKGVKGDAGSAGAAGQPGTAPSVWGATMVERFAVADQSAWPTQWTKRDGATAAAAAQVVGGKGQLNGPAAAGAGTRQEATNMPQTGDPGILLLVTPDSNSIVTAFIGGSGTGAGVNSGALPPYCWAVSLNFGTRAYALLLVINGGITTLASGTFSAGNMPTGVENAIRLERVGNRVRFKTWATSLGYEPVVWISGNISVRYQGIAGVGLNSISATPAVALFDDIFGYQATAPYATSSDPGQMQFAADTDITTGTSTSVAVTPANLANNAILPANITSTDPTVNSDSSAGYKRGQVWVNTNTSAAFVCVSASSGAAVWRRMQADVQVFTASGTWNRPSWTTLTTCHLIAGGGGGGGGARKATSTTSGGGGGGGGSSYSRFEFATQQAPTTLSIAVGAGGGAGAAASADDGNGGNGGSGGGTNLVLNGQTIFAAGGGAGLGGSTTGGNNGVQGSGQTSGGPGGAGGTGTGSNSQQNSSSIAATGGGGGGGLAAGGTANSGGTGQSNMVVGTSAGGSTSAAAVVGKSVLTGSPLGGGGGGGGASSVTNVNQTGANGGSYGGGAGGGGAGINGQTAGAGGTGGPGIAVLISV